MVKARALNQLAFGFDVPRAVSHAAALAGIDARTARTVGEALNSDARAREVIAAEMAVLLDDEISRAMLDAWSAPGKGGHNISFARMLALIVITQRFDLLDRELRTVGAAVLVGEELHTARLGHLKSKIAELMTELKQVERMAMPINRGRA